MQRKPGKTGDIRKETHPNAPQITPGEETYAKKNTLMHHKERQERRHTQRHTP